MQSLPSAFEDLAKEQTKPNATKQTETELREKLTIAVTHLEQAHAQLLQRSNLSGSSLNGLGLKLEAKESTPLLCCRREMPP